MRRILRTLIIALIAVGVSTTLSAQVIISEITESGQVELVNTSADTVNIEEYWLCDRPSYERIATLDRECGENLLLPGDSVVLLTSTISVSGSGGEMALYNSSSFSDTASIVDYVIWGDRSGGTRESVAVAVGQWSDGERAPSFGEGQSLNYDGEGDAAMDFVVSTTSICGVDGSMQMDSCNVMAGSILTSDSLTSLTICVGDGMSDAFTAMVSGASDGASSWVVTDSAGVILELPLGPTFDFEGTQTGVCLVRHLVFDGALEGASVGAVLDSIQGCYQVSNAISVIRVSGEDCPGFEEPCDVEGGSIVTIDSLTEVTICVDDDIAELVEVELSGNVGANSTYLVTDTLGVILAIDSSNVFDCEPAGAGVCLIWHLSYEDGLVGAVVDSNASDLEGCFALSNPITVTRLEGEDCPGFMPPICDVEGGIIITTDSLAEVTICVDDDVAELIEVTLTGNAGSNSAYLVTDTSGTILVMDSSNVFDLEPAGAGVCLIWHLSYEDDVTAAVDSNLSNLEGCFSLSDPIIVTRLAGADCPGFEAPECEVSGGTIVTTDSLTEVTICVDDDVAELIEVNVAGNTGMNSTWVVTDTAGLILAIDSSNVFDFEPAGEGVCLIWHLSYEDGLVGAVIDSSASNLEGCFSLSNPITVTRLAGAACPGFVAPECELSGGTIVTTDSLTEVTICVDDDVAELIEVNVDGNTGMNSIWVVTDTAGLILAIDSSNVFDFEPAGEGVCLIWHLSYEDGLVGAAVDSNASNLEGCFSLSNPITVIRLAGADCPGFVEEPTCPANGGVLTLLDGSTEIMVCAGDGVSDAFNVNLDSVAGANSAWLITDVDGNILAFPFAPPFDFEGAGAGVALIYHLAYEDGLTGASLGGNVNTLEGCFSLSNAITVTRSVVNGGDLQLSSGGDEIILCDDGSSFVPFDVILQNAEGTNAGWILTNGDDEILALPLAPPFDLEGTGSGTNFLRHISFEDGLTGANIGNTVDSLSGCFDLSNPITIVRNGVSGGDLSIDGAEEVTICVGDSIPDPLNFAVVDADGPNAAYVATDTAGIILAISDSSVFDFEGAGPGICLVWHLSFADGLEGAVVDSNANNLQGCYALSNPVTVIRVSGDDCPEPCDVVAGTLEIAGGETSLTICADDGESDTFSVIADSSQGTNNILIITAEDGEILALPDTTAINLEGAGGGICNIYNLTFADGVVAPEIGANISDLSGCFALSNPVSITRLVGDDCPQPCLVEGGTISTEDALMVCADDGDADLVNLTIEGNTGDDNVIVITDADANILNVITGSTVDFEATGSGSALIWNLSSQGDLVGAEVGANAADIEGCFALSNSLEINLLIDEECDALGCGADAGRVASIDGSNELEFCSGDVLFSIENENDAVNGLLYYYVLTDSEDNILEWRLSAAGGDYDLSRFSSGVYHIYGYSTDGSIDILEDAPISSLEGECGDVSVDFINITIISGGVCDEGCHAPRDVRIALAGSNRYSVRWDRVVEAVSYVMEIGFQGEPRSFAVVPVTRNRVFVTGPRNKTLEIRIKSICADGEESPFTRDFFIEVPKERVAGKSFDAYSDQIIVTEVALSESKPLYPNPAFDMINVWYEGFGEAGQLAVYAQDGKKVIATQLSGDQQDHAVDVSELQEGMYFLRITSQGETISQEKFVKTSNR